MSEHQIQTTEHRGASKPGILILIAGPTASGKNTVTKELMQQFPSLQRVVSYTTRQPREGEEYGKDYYFVGRDEFEQLKMQGEFLETVEYAGNCYGTSKKSLLPILDGQDMVRIVTMDHLGTYMDAYRQTFDAKTAKILSANTLPILICPGSVRSQLRRFGARGGNRDGKREEFRRRFKQEREILLEQPELLRTVVYNRDGTLQEAVDEVARLMQQRRFKR